MVNQNEYNEEAEMFEEENQPQNQEEKNNPLEQPTSEEYAMMQQNQYMMSQQNPAARMVSALTSLLAAFMPMAMMGSMTSGMFLQIAWGLSAEDRERLETTYGTWALNRAMRMIAPARGIAALEQACKHQQARYEATIGISGLPAAAPPKRKPRPTKTPTPRAVGLTAGELGLLADDVKEFYRPSKTWPDIDDIKEWAEDRFNKSIGTSAARTVLDKAKREI